MVPALRGGSTRRRRSPRGARIGEGFNRLSTTPDFRGEQGPEVEGATAGAGHTAGGSAQRHEGMTWPGKPGTAPREGQSPEGQTLDVAAG